MPISFSDYLKTKVPDVEVKVSKLLGGEGDPLLGKPKDKAEIEDAPSKPPFGDKPYKSVKDEKQKYSADTGGDKGGLAHEGDKSLKQYKENSSLYTSDEVELNESHNNKKKKKPTSNDCYITDVVTGHHITPMPVEVVRYMSHLMKNNKNMQGRLIKEMKNSGLLSEFMGEMLSHQDAYSEVAGLMGDAENGKKHARKFVGAMNDGYTKYMNEISQASQMLRNNNFMASEAVDMPRHQQDIPSGFSGGMPQMPQSAPMGMPSPSSLDAPSPMASSGSAGMFSEPTPMQTPSPSPMGDMGADAPMPKVSQEAMEKMFAHNNLIGEMARHNYMLHHMKETCEKCGR